MITTVTLNVAVDKAYVIGDFNQGEVMRVQKCTNTPGGKGLNVAKVAKLCGEEVLATGFVGGHAGAYVEDMLKKQNVPSEFVHTKNETRSCINVLAADGPGDLRGGAVRLPSLPEHRQPADSHRRSSERVPPPHRPHGHGGGPAQ